MFPHKAPYAVELLIQDVVPMFSNWTRSSFKNLIVDGTSKPWLQVFVETIQYQFPILGPYFLVKHYENLPMILLHAMYALVLDTNKSPHDVYPPGDVHYTFCKALYNGTVSNPLEIVALMFMGYHAAAFSPSLIGGLNYFTAAEGHAQEMGILENKPFMWEMNGIKFGKDSYSGIKLRQMIAVQLYNIDFYASHFRRVPFSLNLCDLNPKLMEFVDDGKVYNDYYSTKLWIDEFNIFTIGRKASVSDEQEIQELLVGIAEWGKARVESNLFARRMTYSKAHAVFLMQNACYLRMFLKEPDFMEALATRDYDNPILDECYKIAKETTELFLLSIDTRNSKSIFFSPIACYTACYTAGKYLALLQTNQRFKSIVTRHYNKCKLIMECYAKHLIFAEYRLKMMEKEMADPEGAIVEYMQRQEV